MAKHSFIEISIYGGLDCETLMYSFLVDGTNSADDCLAHIGKALRDSGHLCGVARWLRSGSLIACHYDF